jgi:hypothetical protein
MVVLSVPVNNKFWDAGVVYGYSYYSALKCEIV